MAPPQEGVEVAGLLKVIRLTIMKATPWLRRVAKTSRLRERKVKAPPPVITGGLRPLSIAVRPFLSRTPTVITRRAPRTYIAVRILVLTRALPSPRRRPVAEAPR